MRPDAVQDCPKSCLDAQVLIARAFEALPCDAQGGAYEHGYRDAIESMLLALRQHGLDELVLIEVVNTALDALQNNALNEAQQPVAPAIQST